MGGKVGSIYARLRGSVLGRFASGLCQDGFGTRFLRRCCGSFVGDTGGATEVSRIRVSWGGKNFSPVGGRRRRLMSSGRDNIETRNKPEHLLAIALTSTPTQPPPKPIRAPDGLVPRRTNVPAHQRMRVRIETHDGPPLISLCATDEWALPPGHEVGGLVGGIFSDGVFGAASFLFTLSHSCSGGETRREIESIGGSGLVSSRTGRSGCLTPEHIKARLQGPV